MNGTMTDVLFRYCGNKRDF